MDLSTDITAVVPVAGQGTRLLPLTRVLPKALFPLVSPDGQVRPVADWIVRHALTVCRRAILVTSPGQDALLRRYFAGEADLAGRLDYVTDVPPYGFGYAVWAARRAVGDGNVMVLLGDHVHLAAPGAPAPAQQVAAAFLADRPAAAVGVQVADETQLGLVGVCRGEPAGAGLYRCTRLIEKPDAATAKAELVTPALPAGKYLAHAGIYVFTPEVFECLDALVVRRRADQEVGLTQAQQMLLDRGRPYLLRLLDGTAHDTGTPAEYVRTQTAILRAGRTAGLPVN